MSGELFKKILSHMDSLARTELIELQAESRRALEGDCSQALYPVIRALDELAKVELVNRDLMGSS
jgi:hypothetical protein